MPDCRAVTISLRDMSLTRSSLVVSALTAASLVASVALNIVTAYVFGASDGMDAYLAAMTVPTYIITIITGMISVTLIPAFVTARQNDERKAWALVSGLTNLAIIATTVIVGVGIAGAHPIMRATAPGFSESLQAYSATLLQVYFPVVAFTVINELIASVYYAHNRFVVPLLNKMITPVVSIIFVLALSHRLDAMSMSLASLVGAALQCVLLAIGFIRNPGFRYTFRSRSLNDDVRGLLRLMLPLGGSMLLYKVVPVFDRYIVSELKPGSISSLGYATRLQLLAVQVISASISLAVFPIMAQQAASGDRDALRETTSKVIRVLFYVSVPIAIVSIVFGTSLLELVFERGAFTREVVDEVYPCFVAYMISLPIVVTGSVVSQGLYVLQDTRTIALLGVAETVVYVSLCFVLVDHLGVLVVPVVYGIYFTASVIVIGARFRHLLQLGGGRRVLKACLIHVSIGIVVGALALLARNSISVSNGVSVVLCGVVVLVYVLVSKALHVEEADLLWAKARSFILRR